MHGSVTHAGDCLHPGHLAARSRWPESGHQAGVLTDRETSAACEPLQASGRWTASTLQYIVHREQQGLPQSLSSPWATARFAMTGPPHPTGARASHAVVANSCFLPCLPGLPVPARGHGITCACRTTCTCRPSVRTPIDNSPHREARRLLHSIYDPGPTTVSLLPLFPASTRRAAQAIYAIQGVPPWCPPTAGRHSCLPTKKS